jgi:hypothetical protein
LDLLSAPQFQRVCPVSCVAQSWRAFTAGREFHPALKTILILSPLFFVSIKILQMFSDMIESKIVNEYLMENNKGTKPKQTFSLKISEVFLEGTLFLIFGSKKWRKGKRPVPPVYIIGMIIILFILILILK